MRRSLFIAALAFASACSDAEPQIAIGAKLIGASKDCSFTPDETWAYYVVDFHPGELAFSFEVTNELDDEAIILTRSDCALETDSNGFSDDLSSLYESCEGLTLPESEPLNATYLTELAPGASTIVTLAPSYAYQDALACVVDQLPVFEPDGMSSGAPAMYPLRFRCLFSGDTVRGRAVESPTRFESVGLCRGCAPQAPCTGI